MSEAVLSNFATVLVRSIPTENHCQIAFIYSDYGTCKVIPLQAAMAHWNLLAPSGSFAALSFSASCPSSGTMPSVMWNVSILWDTGGFRIFECRFANQRTRITSHPERTHRLHTAEGKKTGGGQFMRYGGRDSGRGCSDRVSPSMFRLSLD